MEITDKQENENWNLVERVNPLIEKAFGKGFKGNYDNVSVSTFCNHEGLKEVGRLAMIAKNGFVSYRFAGELGASKEDDGSVIGVFLEYNKQAQKYADLYKKEFGKEVRVVFVDKISPSDTNFFLEFRKNKK
jgi:hypothetical protein